MVHLDHVEQFQLIEMKNNDTKKQTKQQNILSSVATIRIIINVREYLIQLADVPTYIPTHMDSRTAWL